MECILLKQPYEVSFSGNPMPFVFSLSPYGDSEKLQNLQLQVSVSIEQADNLFSEIKAQTFFPDANGLIQFDVRSFIHAYLDYYTPKPSLKTPVLAKNQSKRYKVSYTLIRDNQIIRQAQDSDILYAIKGGLAYEHWHPSEFFSANVVTGKKSLQFFARGEKVFADEVKYLFWTYFFDDQAEQQIIFTITLDDGNDIIHTLPYKIKCRKWEVCCVPVGFNALQLDSLVPDGNLAVKYSVSVSCSDGIIVNPFVYTLDYRNFYNTYLLLYRNSTGGIETLKLRGVVDFTADYDRQQVQRIQPPSYFQNMNIQPQVIQLSNPETAKFIGDTGFNNQKVSDKLRDLFVSPQILEFTDGKFLPVIVNTKNTNFFGNRDNLISVQIPWQRAFVNDYYTPAELMQNGRICPSLEKFVVKQISKTQLKIMWSVPIPYDRVEVDFIIQGVTTTYKFDGNANTITLPFENPATVNNPVNIVVKGRVLCNEDADPVDAGPFTTINLMVTAGGLPIAVDDTYSINAGFNTAVLLNGSVLSNDSDPDGNPIEVVVASGATNAGGQYSIDSAGIVHYKPPSPTYNGKDYFDYQVREVGATATASARVSINVGIVNTIYVRLFTDIVSISSTGSGDGAHSSVTSHIYVKFFSDFLGQVPVDVTNANITLNYQKIEKNLTVTTTTNLTALVSGKTFDIFTGITGREPRTYSLKYGLLPGIGYTVI